MCAILCFVILHSTSDFLKDWIHGDGIDIKGKGRADAKFSEEGEAAEAKLRASYVLVPPGDESKSVQCPICKETLKCEFLEEDEDWAWKNAVRVQGRVSILHSALLDYLNLTLCQDISRNVSCGDRSGHIPCFTSSA